MFHDPVFTPNTVIDGDGFYVSYNIVDSRIYGSDTTALVIGQMQHFYILNGDHRDAYRPLIAQGLQSCLNYFASQSDQISKFSEKITVA